VNVVRTGGLEIAYERVGEGPPLAFAHVAGEDGRVCQPQLAALADEFTVVAWTSPARAFPRTYPLISALRSTRAASRR
jgi:hypothetical protein